MNKYALYIGWSGNQPKDEDVVEIAKYLESKGICRVENISIKEFDEDAIAKAVVSSASTIKIETKENVNHEPVRNAVVFIGTQYQNFLRDRDYVGFALALSSDVSKANSKGVSTGTVRTNNDIALIRAVEILSTTDMVVPKKLANEYDITQNVINIIKNIYDRL